jgi:hypothetical protein
MYRCERCFYANASTDAKVCPRCGTAYNGGQVRTTRTLSVRPTTAQLRLHREHVGKLSPNDVAIYMPELEGPLIVNVETELILGRIDRNDGRKHPEAFDLTNFEAMERGVSRAHVALRRYNRDIVAIDLMSTNGTWVNNYRLKPYLPIAFTSGDKLTLAKLSMYIYTYQH